MMLLVLKLGGFGALRLARGLRKAGFAFLVVCCLGCFGFRELNCGPSLEGDGSLHEIHIPNFRGTLRCTLDARGHRLYFVLTGPRPTLYCTDLSLHPVSVAEGVWDCIAPGDAAYACAYSDLYGFRLLSVPDLKLVDTAGMSNHSATELLPHERGWIWVGTRGEVARVDARVFRVAKTGRSSLSRVKGAAIDPKSGRLLLTGDDRYLEEFDADRMVSLGRWDLGMEPIAGIRAAGDGTAWVATEIGVFAQIDTATHSVVRQVRVMEGTEKVRVHLALSQSGRLLAASATRRLGNHRFAAALNLYRLENGSLVPAATARTALGGMIYGLTLVESEEMVVLAKQSPTLVWRYGDDG